MNPEKKELPKPKEYEGMSQYRPPLNYELVGKSFELVMDTGYVYALTFLDRVTLSYGQKGETPAIYSYDCLKADEDTYFINFSISKKAPVSALAIILDMEQSLVTTGFASVDVNPRYPTMPKTEINFGAVRREDGTIPTIRHGYTADMVGRAIAWNYGTSEVVHIYSSERYYRLAVTPEETARRKAADPEAYARREANNARRLYEEPADYIKIKDGMYIFNANEVMKCREVGFGSNLLFLMDLNRLHDVGRSFGYKANGETENYTFGAFGRYYDCSELIARPSTEFIR